MAKQVKHEWRSTTGVYGWCSCGWGIDPTTNPTAQAAMAGPRPEGAGEEQGGATMPIVQQKQDVESYIEKYVAKLPEAPGCWLWLGSVSTGGYGYTSRGAIAGRSPRAHRAVYEYYRGPIPAGLTLDHLCRVRRCVNPAHLEPTSTRENLLRGVGHAAKNARKTHCAHGHSFTPENTKLRLNGSRRCLACDIGRVR